MIGPYAKLNLRIGDKSILQEGSYRIFGAYLRF
jgi:hypothetical protein